MSSYGDTFTDLANAYTDREVLVLRWLSVAASCISIVAGLVAFYLYINMKARVFRHHLILMVLMCDFGKAVVLLWYPARVLLVASAYNNINFCDIVGYATSVFIECADFAVLALAIHTALVVFRKDRGQAEGGLYKFRYLVYAFVVVVPMIMAALAFIRGRKGYLPYVTWCYLPVRPTWYRLVLSWVPRYLIAISIVSIYLSIFVYIKLEYRAVVKSFSQTYQNEERTSVSDDIGMGSRPRGSVRSRLRLARASAVTGLSYLPGFSFLEDKIRDELDQSAMDSALNSPAHAIAEFKREAMLRFQARRIMIERQITLIFIYPAAYLFLWLAPFALQCTQFNYVFEHGPVFWLSAIAAFMQPFNCCIDTIAFCIRERPWRGRQERVFTRQNSTWVKRTLTWPSDSATATAAPTTATATATATTTGVTGVSAAVSSGSSSCTKTPSNMKEPQAFVNADSLAGTPLELETGQFENPFEYTAKRVDFGDDRDSDYADEIDLLEFLK